MSCEAGGARDTGEARDDGIEPVRVLVGTET